MKVGAANIEGMSGIRQLEIWAFPFGLGAPKRWPDRAALYTPKYIYFGGRLKNLNNEWNGSERKKNDTYDNITNYSIFLP